MGNDRELIKEESLMAKEISFEASLELQKAISYLEEVTSSLRDGKVVLERAEDFVVLEPAHLVQMKLEASVEGEREGIKLKFNWEKPIEFDLKISSKEPAVQQKPEEESESEEEEEEEEEEETY
jgi:amphi-Trp domain-containing protein